ncbi:MAG: CDP-diacylglycerol--serine O-phosphatidyltransferase [Deltaproteobacteria bacterium]|jgi:CDP-diacylglycerol---serine O-phosphatidyltransferase|nr:CDP-diacylglycerol--serine O-phosphatidyltransferase [Deltaproteobacteria bacterium]
MNMKGHRRRDSMKKGVYLLPNLCTSASLFCGFFSVVKSLSGDFKAAAWAILLAGIFDLIDGRLARLAKAESQFGVEYDSLVDLASFGLAPGILMYTWSLYGLKKLGWLAAFLFFACGALRLARFNVQHDDVEMEYFQGLPIPVAAYVLATYVIFYHHLFIFPPEGSITIAVITIILSLLMVSTIRYRSLKVIDIKKRNSFFALVLVVIGIFLVAIKPEVTMFVLTVGYVASGVVEELVTLHQSRKFVRKMKERRAERKQYKLELMKDGDDNVVDLSDHDKSKDKNRANGTGV